jgi:hypothetical protein
MTFLPAPPNSGIRFRRVDLEGKPEIEARLITSATTNRSTSLSKGNAKIHTVEHVLAAFAGRGIDNAIVELDANEPPIGDGSAREYVKMIQAAGVAPQDEPREVFAFTPGLLREGRDEHFGFSARRIQDHLHQRRCQRALHPVLQRRSDAGELGARPVQRAHFLFLRGDRILDQERVDQGRQPGKRRGHPR